MRTKIAIASLALALCLAAGTARAEKLGPLNVTLRFVPQESVGSDNPTFEAGISDRPVQVRIEEGRTIADLAVIGESTDDDDKVWPIRATNDPIAWANEVLAKTAGDWGIRVSADAPLALTGKLTRLRATESNKAVGSVYNADVQVTFQLADAKGRLLWEGAASGDATRYGKARSADNVNEVLSDAVKEAYANVVAETKLQEAWLGKSAPMAGSMTKPAAAPGDVLTPEAMLDQLVQLKKKGFGTDLLVDFVHQKGLSRSLSADDLVAWKNAGMPQEVIKAALEKGK
ncbi:MAG TPA: hypothetical protein VN783_11885 [Thermoanaerobaculia bacterium]|nr:hypothetical protein [Thermoanaerobaculia bacterium]